MITEDGYYRVKYKGKWAIACYYTERSSRYGRKGTKWWRLFGPRHKYETHLSESAFQEIDPQRIIMPDEKEVNNDVL